MSMAALMSLLQGNRIASDWEKNAQVRQDLALKQKQAENQYTYEMEKAKREFPTPTESALHAQEIDKLPKGMTLLNMMQGKMTPAEHEANVGKIGSEASMNLSHGKSYEADVPLKQAGANKANKEADLEVPSKAHKNEAEAGEKQAIGESIRGTPDQVNQDAVTFGGLPPDQQKLLQGASVQQLTEWMHEAEARKAKDSVAAIRHVLRSDPSKVEGYMKEPGVYMGAGKPFSLLQNLLNPGASEAEIE